LVAVRHLSPQQKSILPTFIESSSTDSFGNRCGSGGRAGMNPTLTFFLTFLECLWAPPIPAGLPSLSFLVRLVDFRHLKVEIRFSPQRWRPVLARRVSRCSRAHETFGQRNCEHCR
jgi:hypothetical protein